MIEEGAATHVAADGKVYNRVVIERLPALECDSLALLRVAGRPPALTSPMRLPARTPHFAQGMGVMLQSRCGQEFHERRGTIRSLNGAGASLYVMSDVPISLGESGSPLLRNGKLVGICQGRLYDGGRAVATPVTSGTLSALRCIRRRRRRPPLMVAAVAILAGLCAFGYSMWSSFTISSIQPSDDRMVLTVANALRPALRASWAAKLSTPVLHYTSFGAAAGPEAVLDHMVVGTSWQPEHNGEVAVYSASGRRLWGYCVPNGDCIYTQDREAYDGFDVTSIAVRDVTGDRVNDLLVVFTHHYAFPSKLMVFSHTGRILAEYWHPGPITHVAAGRVGLGMRSMVVASARNASLAAYVPEQAAAQCIFAFEWDSISGQGPVYIGDGATGTELWYRVVADAGMHTPAAVDGVSLEDIDRDGDNEIRVTLSDGRFYFLNETGNIVGIATNTQWIEAYGALPVPSLMSLTLDAGGGGAGIAGPDR